MFPSFRGRTLFAGVMFLLMAGCASLPPQQSFNRQASQDIKTIAVLPMRETEPNVFILNNPGLSFGLIGGLISEADLATKRKKLRDTLSNAGVDYVAVFKNQLTQAMSRRGYALLWPEATIETTKIGRNKAGIRNVYTATTTADAQLDVNFGFVGYAAAGATGKAPYRPTAAVIAQLVSANGKSKLFTDTIVYHNVFKAEGAVNIAPDEHYSYPNFSDVEKAGPDAAKGISVAVEAVADKLAEQL